MILCWLCNFLNYVNWIRLCLGEAEIIESFKFQIKAVYRRDQRFWARRPLSGDMVVYAAADVLALVPNIYLAMKRYITYSRS